MEDDPDNAATPEMGKGSEELTQDDQSTDSGEEGLKSADDAPVEEADKVKSDDTEEETMDSSSDKEPATGREETSQEVTPPNKAKRKGAADQKDETAPDEEEKEQTPHPATIAAASAAGAAAGAVAGAATGAAAGAAAGATTRTAVDPAAGATDSEQTEQEDSQRKGKERAQKSQKRNRGQTGTGENEYSKDYPQSHVGISEPMHAGADQAPSDEAQDEDENRDANEGKPRQQTKGKSSTYDKKGGSQERRMPGEVIAHSLEEGDKTDQPPTQSETEAQPETEQVGATAPSQDGDEQTTPQSRAPRETKRTKVHRKGKGRAPPQESEEAQEQPMPEKEEPEAPAREGEEVPRPSDLYSTYQPTTNYINYNEPKDTKGLVPQGDEQPPSAPDQYAGELEAQQASSDQAPQDQQAQVPDEAQAPLASEEQPPAAGSFYDKPTEGETGPTTLIAEEGSGRARILILIIIIAIVAIALFAIFSLHLFGKSTTKTTTIPSIPSSNVVTTTVLPQYATIDNIDLDENYSGPLSSRCSTALQAVVLPYHRVLNAGETFLYNITLNNPDCNSTITSIVSGTSGFTIVSEDPTPPLGLPMGGSKYFEIEMTAPNTTFVGPLTLVVSDH